MINVNFRGSFLKEVNIKKLDNDGKYKPIKANFVELDHDDFFTLEKIADKWENSISGMCLKFPESLLLPPDIMQNKRNKFLPLTKNMAKDEEHAFLSSRVLGPHFYVVTTQTDNFKKMDADSILGLATLSVSKDVASIDLLHVRPDCISENYGNQVLRLLKYAFYKLFGMQDKIQKRPYAYIGDSIIETIKKMFCDKTLSLVPLNNAICFYAQYGFKRANCGDIEYVLPPTKKITNRTL